MMTDRTLNVPLPHYYVSLRSGVRWEDGKRLAVEKSLRPSGQRNRESAMNKKQVRVVVSLTTAEEMEVALNQPCGDGYYLRSLSFQAMGVAAVFSLHAEPKTKAGACA